MGAEYMDSDMMISTVIKGSLTELRGPIYTCSRESMSMKPLHHILDENVEESSTLLLILSYTLMPSSAVYNRVLNGNRMTKDRKAL
ncbi:hypothetical protein GALMADRAFT_248851 [Galerina marginata CBS 339.88]|uniref:Uncharacterized protein n=1 Tax=Galerina marginata (strain CBS 339.88) TaxID=685588 RepID=A0A067SVW5_GALM3|nr:hypothetical protein GALMADRAFT_248851 [Galerina marginata CBS 339.88]